MSPSNEEPRGLRNNNPGNLRWREDIHYVGELSRDSEGYAVFDNLENGVRALYLDLHAKWSRGLRTIRQIIEVFAPPGENPTEAYILFIKKRLGGKDDILLTEENLIALTDIMCRFECGEWIDPRAVAVGSAKAIQYLKEKQS